MDAVFFLFFGFHLTLLLKTVLKQLVYRSKVLVPFHFEQLSLLSFSSLFACQPSLFKMLLIFRFCLNLQYLTIVVINLTVVVAYFAQFDIINALVIFRNVELYISFNCRLCASCQIV